MRIRNTNPLGDVEVVALQRVVDRGEVIDVPDDVAALLLDQVGNWEPETASVAPDPTPEEG